MSQTLANTRMLQQPEVQGWIIDRLQGSFVAGDFLPFTTTGNTVFKWFYRGIIGGMTPEVGENDYGEMIHTEYEQRSATVHHYRERTAVSLYANDATIDFADLVRDDVNFLTDRLALRLESSRINAIIGAVNLAAGWEERFWTNLAVGGRQWVGGAGAVSIIDDIIDARERIAKYSRMHTDTILCGTRIAAGLQKNVETRDWDRKGPMSLEIAKEGTMLGITQPKSNREQANIGRLAGHEVYVSSAATLVNEDDLHGGLTPLMDNDVYLFKRGTDLGRTVFFETPNMRTKAPDQFGRLQEWQIGASFEPIVYRPQLVYAYRNCIAP